MNRRNILTAAAVALGTMAAVLAVALPGALNADDPAPGPKPENQQPTLLVGGVKMTLQPQAASYEPGTSPVLNFTAQNTSDAAAVIQAYVKVMDTAPVPVMSRMGPMPRESFSRPLPLVLAPGEIIKLAVNTEAPVAAGHRISYALTVDKQSILVPGFRVPGTAADGAGNTLTNNLPIVMAASVASNGSPATQPDR